MGCKMNNSTATSEFVIEAKVREFDDYFWHYWTGKKFTKSYFHAKKYKLEREAKQAMTKIKDRFTSTTHRQWRITETLP